MLKVIVLENYNNDSLVDIIIDDEKPVRRVMNLRELNACIQETNDKNLDTYVIIEDEIKINTISLENYEKEYDVILNTFTYRGEIKKATYDDYQDTFLKTYKNYALARKFAIQAEKDNDAVKIVEM